MQRPVGEQAMTEQKWWELPGPPPSPELLEAMKEAEAYGRYWRVTGREAPPDWKPGDPIPEPNYDEDDTDGDPAVIVCEEPK
jgi:hypothetical protein